MSTTNNASLASIKPGTKVLFANFPGDGHFNPLTGLAAHLKSVGCDVRWYTSTIYEAKIQKLGIPLYPFQRVSHILDNTAELVNNPERLKAKSAVAKLNFDLINVFILRGSEFFEDVKEIYEDFAFDIVIADICFTGMPYIKDLMKIPVIAVGVFPLANASKDLPPSGLGMTPGNGFLGRLKQDFLRLLARKVLFAKSNKVLKAEFEKYNLTGGDQFVFDVLYAKADTVLQSGCPSFEYKRSDLNPKIKFVGALLPERGGVKVKAQWFDERIKQYKKVIVVTQGTVETDINKLLVPTLEAFKNSDVLVIATTGGSGTEELRQRFPQKNMIIEDFIPFEAVMPFAQVYITNGGFGGVMLGIQHNLPLVVAGVHEGKNEINARIGYFGLGIDLKTETPKPLQIRYAVEAILNNDEYKAKVSRLKKELASYQPAVLCEHYVAELLPHRKKIVTNKAAERELVY